MKHDKPFDHVHAIRLDKDKLVKAKKLGLDTNEIFRKALNEAILNSDGVCPTCKRKWLRDENR